MKYTGQVLFVVAMAIVVYGAFNNSETSEINYKRGLQAACFLFIVQGTLRSDAAPFSRPFEGLWRGMTRYLLIYFVAIVFLLYQSASDARMLMKYLYPELGKPVPKSMHTYDDDCEFEWINIWNNMDHYYVQHVLGWFWGAFIFRDALMANIMSLMHEVLELSWQHVLPHFRECWWDHVFLDVLLSNTPAIFFSLWVQKKLNVKQYDFFGRKGKKSIRDWDIFRCHRRFGTTIYVLGLAISNFLTGFFLINCLWVPPKNYLNVYRLTVVYMSALLSFSESYKDIESWGTEARGRNPVTAEFRWMAFAGALVELLISWKFRKDAGNTLENPTPLYISIPWTIVLTTIAGYYLYLRFKPGHTTKTSGNEKIVPITGSVPNSVSAPETAPSKKSSPKKKTN